MGLKVVSIACLFVSCAAFIWFGLISDRACWCLLVAFLVLLVCPVHFLIVFFLRSASSLTCCLLIHAASPPDLRRHKVDRAALGKAGGIRALHPGGGKQCVEGGREVGGGEVCVTSFVFSVVSFYQFIEYNTARRSRPSRPRKSPSLSPWQKKGDFH